MSIGEYNAVFDGLRMCKPRINRPRYGSLHILLFTIERLNYDAKLAVELVHLVERNPCVRLTRSR